MQIVVTLRIIGPKTTTPPVSPALGSNGLTMVLAMGRHQVQRLARLLHPAHRAQARLRLRPAVWHQALAHRWFQVWLIVHNL